LWVQIRNENRIVQPVAFLGRNEGSGTCSRTVWPVACPGWKEARNVFPEQCKCKASLQTTLFWNCKVNVPDGVPKHSGMKISSLPFEIGKNCREGKKIFQLTGKTIPECFGVFPDLKLGVVLGMCTSLMRPCIRK